MELIDCSLCRGRHDRDPYIRSGCPYDVGPESFGGSDFPAEPIADLCNVNISHYRPQADRGGRPGLPPIEAISKLPRAVVNSKAAEFKIKLSELAKPAQKRDPYPLDSWEE
jgi:hypothetical protein